MNKSDYLRQIRLNTSYQTFRGVASLTRIVLNVIAALLLLAAVALAVVTLLASEFAALPIAISCAVSAGLTFLLGQLLSCAAVALADLCDAALEATARARDSKR